jgi:alcohol dehydrogenase
MDKPVTMEGIRKTVFGPGAVGQVGPECKNVGATRALLVIDKQLSDSEIGRKVRESLKRDRIRTAVFSEVTPEPEPDLADAGAGIARAERVQCVVGVGGGSTLDVAKAVAALARNEGKAMDYIGLGLVKRRGLPSIMVPTTAGTGSEVTFTSVFTMRATRTKGGINSPFLYPHTAILDPELTLGLPPNVTASTGMDALTHAVESYTSLQAHFMSEPISLKAIEVIGANLRGAVFDGGRYGFRESMLKGSYMAGLGLAMAGVGAVHALAYPLGGFFDIPHGMANSVMLPYVLEYNYPGSIEKFAQIALAMNQGTPDMTDRELAGRAVKGIFELSADLGIPRTLKELNVPASAVPEMAEAALKVARPMMNNPRPMTLQVVKQVYQKAFEGKGME